MDFAHPYLNFKFFSSLKCRHKAYVGVTEPEVSQTPNIRQSAILDLLSSCPPFWTIREAYLLVFTGMQNLLGIHAFVSMI